MLECTCSHRTVPCDGREIQGAQRQLTRLADAKGVMLPQYGWQDVPAHAASTRRQNHELKKCVGQHFGGWNGGWRLLGCAAAQSSCTHTVYKYRAACTACMLTTSMYLQCFGPDSAGVHEILVGTIKSVAWLLKSPSGYSCPHPQTC